MAKSGNWKVKMKRVRELRVQGSGILFERAKLLVEIAESQDYRDYCRDEELAEHDLLDPEVSDFCRSFALVQNVFKANPDKTEWEKHGFAYLLAEYRESQKKTKELKNRVNWREKYEQAQNEIVMLKGQIKGLQQALKALQVPAA